MLTKLGCLCDIIGNHILYITLIVQLTCYCDPHQHIVNTNGFVFQRTDTSLFVLHGILGKYECEVLYCFSVSSNWDIKIYSKL